MIYLDSSVVLAEIFAEQRRPPLEFWLRPFSSSRLLEFEVWNRLHVAGGDPERQGRARTILRRVQHVELTGAAVERALRPFPLPVRTLDGLHLATIDWMRSRGGDITLASYDIRLLAAANAMGFPILQP